MDRVASTPFHPGEQALQATVGVRERLAEIGHKVIRDHMPDQHRELFDKLPTLLVAAQDADGQPWATMLQGPPGFVHTPDARHMRIGALPEAADPVAPLLVEGVAVGVLGLEPHTRRRNRANGRVQTIGPAGFMLEVLQSFGNCPKYIHGRRPEPLPPRASSPTALRLGPAFDGAPLALLQRADTLFIASASARQAGHGGGEGVDVSHRGGPAGFVAIEPGPRGLRLTLPDYLGNFFFNTLGNLLAWPLAGLLVLDHDDGSVLQLAALASVDTDPAAVARFAGAQRLLRLDLLHGWWRPAALPLRWSPPVAPPQFGG
jgi:predicted pyridoxine 5'-phosphate oxidase superfamily flavin-nucleotide-binding protein